MIGLQIPKMKIFLSKVTGTGRSTVIQLHLEMPEHTFTHFATFDTEDSHYFSVLRHGGSLGKKTQVA